jgi:hypothetical protein
MLEMAHRPGVDVDQTERILGNLLSNALRFTATGGRVDVDVALSGPRAVVSVRDTGRGIPEEALPRLFERFYQVDGSSTRSREGMGIGLALVRELMTLHGGAVDVESKVGKGSTFRLSFPLAAEEPPAADASQAEPGPIGTSEEGPTGPDGTGEGEAEEGEVREGEADPERPAVLVVDDNRDVREYVRGILAPRFTVLEAGDGVRALELARDRLPDVIVADVMFATAPRRSPTVSLRGNRVFGLIGADRSAESTEPQR